MKIRKCISIVVLMAFIGSSIKAPVYAQMVDPMPHMSAPGTMVRLSPDFTPAYLKGIVIHPENALKFDFIINRGDKALTEAQKKIEYTKLTKYFLASLAIPDDDQWVNLSPYEKDRIIKDSFGKTEMGRDLLAQDYMLKQITASLIYPEDNLGKKFWNKVYAEAQKQYGTTDIPVNTFNKVWILPDDALIYEKGNTAYVLKNHLKVMLEEDYLSLQKHAGIQSVPVNKSHTIASKIVKEIVLPGLEREVNEGQNFAAVRQVYSGMLLAAWYKHALKESLLSRIYANKARVKGVDSDPKTNEMIYNQYLRAYKKGVFNFIKDDVDKYSNQTIPRKYFSGGTSGYLDKDYAQIVKTTSDQAAFSAVQQDLQAGDTDLASIVAEEKAVADQAMNTHVLTTDEMIAHELPRIIEYEIMRQILKDTTLYQAIAKAQNNAYAIDHHQPVSDQDLSSKAVYRNMAGFFATWEGVDKVAVAQAKRPSVVAYEYLGKIEEAIKIIDAHQRGEPEPGIDDTLMMWAHLAHSTWLSTQFDDEFKTGRFGREIVKSESELTLAQIRDDLVQIKAALNTVYNFVTTRVNEQLSESKANGFPKKIDGLIKNIQRSRVLFSADQLRIRQTAVTVMSAHHDQKRGQGTLYFNHQLGVANEALDTFNVSDTIMIVIALLHDTNEDQADFFAHWRNFARTAIRNYTDQKVVSQKTDELNAVLLGVRLLSKLEAVAEYEGWSEDKLLEEYYKIMVDPKAKYKPFAGSEDIYYTDHFIRQVQLIKLSDVIYNLGDLKSFFDVDMTQAGAQKQVDNGNVKVQKSFRKFFQFVLPILVNQSKHLTQVDANKFFGRIDTILSNYRKLEGPQYAQLIAQAESASVQFEDFKKQYYSDHAMSAFADQTTTRVKSALEHMQIGKVQSVVRTITGTQYYLKPANFLSPLEVKYLVQSIQDLGVKLNKEPVGLKVLNDGLRFFILDERRNTEGNIKMLAQEIERMASSDPNWLSSVVTLMAMHEREDDKGMVGIPAIAVANAAAGRARSFQAEPPTTSQKAGNILHKAVLGLAILSVSTMPFLMPWAARHDAEEFNARMVANFKMPANSTMPVVVVPSGWSWNIGGKALSDAELLALLGGHNAAIENNGSINKTFIIPNHEMFTFKWQGQTSTVGALKQMLAQSGKARSADKIIVVRVKVSERPRKGIHFQTAENTVLADNEQINAQEHYLVYGPSGLQEAVNSASSQMKAEQEFITIQSAQQRQQGVASVTTIKNAENHPLWPQGDKAMKGGIDFNAANLNLQIKRDGNGVPLPISRQDLENIKIEGLIPVIISIQPVSSSPLLSSLQTAGA